VRLANACAEATLEQELSVRAETFAEFLKARYVRRNPNPPDQISFRQDLYAEQPNKHPTDVVVALIVLRGLHE